MSSSRKEQAKVPKHGENCGAQGAFRFRGDFSSSSAGFKRSLGRENVTYLAKRACKICWQETVG